VSTQQLDGLYASPEFGCLLVDRGVFGNTPRDHEVLEGYDDGADRRGGVAEGERRVDGRRHPEEFVARPWYVGEMHGFEESVAITVGELVIRCEGLTMSGREIRKV